MAKGNKRNQSVSDFPAEFFDIWTAACQRQLQLRFEQRGTATNLKHRLYTFRKRLMQESPQAGQQFMQVDLTVKQEGIFSILCDYIPEWKQQVHAMAGGLNAPAFSSVHLEHLQEQLDHTQPVPTIIMEASGAADPLPPPMPEVGSDGSALDKTLSNLGYSSDSTEENK